MKAEATQRPNSPEMMPRLLSAWQALLERPSARNLAQALIGPCHHLRWRGDPPWAWRKKPSCPGTSPTCALSSLSPFPQLVLDQHRYILKREWLATVGTGAKSLSLHHFLAL